MSDYPVVNSAVQSLNAIELKQENDIFRLFAIAVQKVFEATISDDKESLKQQALKALKDVENKVGEL